MYRRKRGYQQQEEGRVKVEKEEVRVVVVVVVVDGESGSYTRRGRLNGKLGEAEEIK